MVEGLQPAAGVITKCGGIEATAKIIGRHRSVVNRWLRPHEFGGTGGNIPMHHAHTLLATVPGLTEGDFFRKIGKSQPPKSAAAPKRGKTQAETEAA